MTHLPIFNPLELHGADSILFMVVLATVFHILSWGLRHGLLQARKLTTKPRPLSTVELAILCDGLDRASAVALYELVQQNQVQVDSQTGYAELTEAAGDAGSPVHDAILQKLSQGPVHLHVLRRSVEPELTRLERNLELEGYLLSRQAQIGHALKGFLVALIPTAYMIVKAIVGSSQGYPIGFLVLIMLISSGIAIVHFFVRRRITPPAQSVITGFEGRRVSLPVTDPARFALDGPGVIAATSLALIPQLMVIYPTPPRQGNHDSSGVSGCSSSGCGGGGCGGGGCGG